MPLRRAPFLVSVLSLCCASAWAETESACPTPLPYRSGSPVVRAAADPTAPIHVWAREVQTEKDGATNLEGTAELTRGGDRITADHMRYEKPTNTVEADGDVQFRNAAGDTFRTEELRLQLDTRIGEIGPSRYTVNNDRARGDAARIEFLGPDYIRLTDARYTTCRAGQDDWFLKVSRLDLDTDEDIGTAWHATIKFFDVPIFYFPYASFPISDERKSGFLFPRAGHSSNLGYEFSSPYYFNLAPNYDATVTPRFLSKRGLQLQDEFRYLTRDSNGMFEFDILPNDKVTDDDRAVGAFRHRQTFSPFWSGNVDMRWVSDKDYFGDFGDRLSLTSQTQLPQTADVTYRGPAWTFTTRLSDHQTIDRAIGPESEP